VQSTKKCIPNLTFIFTLHFDISKYHVRVCQHTHGNNKRATSGSVGHAEEIVSGGTSPNVKIVCGPNRGGRKRKAKSVMTTALDRYWNDLPRPQGLSQHFHIEVTQLGYWHVNQVNHGHETHCSIKKLAMERNGNGWTHVFLSCCE
jgi:hypothetical protein